MKSGVYTDTMPENPISNTNSIEQKDTRNAPEKALDNLDVLFSMVTSKDGVQGSQQKYSSADIKIAAIDAILTSRDKREDILATVTQRLGVREAVRTIAANFDTLGTSGQVLVHRLLFIMRKEIELAEAAKKKQ